MWGRRLLCFSIILLSFSIQAKISTPLSKITLDGVTLEFFPEVLSLMEEISKGAQSDEPQPPQLKCVALNDVVDNCPSDSLNTLHLACEQTLNPLSYFSHFAPATPQAGESKTLEGITRLIGVSLSRAKVPKALTAKKYQKLTESVLLKIRHESLLNELKHGRHLLSKSSFNSCTSKSLIQNATREIKKAISRIEGLVESGHNQALKDQKLVEASGRNRKLDTIMSDEELRWMALAIGAASWRARGAGLYKKVNGTQFLRTQFLLNPFTALINKLSGNSVWFAAKALYARIFKGYAEHFDMGTVSGDKYTDHKNMVKRGHFQIKWANSALKRQGYDTTALKAAGRQMGHCYYYAYEKLSKVSWGDELEAPLEPLVPKGDAIAWGEVCTGAALGLGFADTLLAGYQ